MFGLKMAASSSPLVGLNGCLPGSIAILASDARAITSGSAHACEVASGHIEKGRVVAVAHESLIKNVDKHDGLSHQLRNWLHWLQQGDDDGCDIKIAFAGKKHSPQAWLTALSLKWTIVDDVKDARVIVWMGHTGSGDVIKPGATTFDYIGDAVAKGAGLLVAMCPWGFCQITHADLKDECAQNRVLLRAGLLFLSSYGTGGSTMDCSPVAELRQGQLNVGFTVAQLAGSDPNPTPDQLKVALLAVNHLPNTLPPHTHADVIALTQHLDALLEPTKLREVWQNQLEVEHHPSVMLAVARMHQQQAIGPVHDLFPGVCTADEERRSITHTDVTIQPKEWLSLNAWVNAGDSFQLEVGHSSLPLHKLHLRVGCHSDKLWHKSSWKRWPEVSSQFALEAKTSQHQHAWGGLLYLVNTTDKPIEATITVHGAVPSVHLDVRMDVSALAEQKGRLASTSVPWSEMSGEKMTFSLPTSALRKVESPEAVMAHWDAVVDSHRDLKRLETPLLRRERTVFDKQISAGYLHSGYPIMAHLDQVTVAQDKGATVLDLPRLQEEGTWGMYHELGHNQQESAWTFSGAGEVTVNLFTLYSMQRLHGIEPVLHPWILKQKAKAKAYLQDETSSSKEKWAQWKRDAGMALWMYAQLQHEFGWDLYHKVFVHYRTANLKPTDDIAKHRRFITECSRASKHNLEPYFRLWCMEVGDWQLEETLRELPVYDGKVFWKDA